MSFKSPIQSGDAFGVLLFTGGGHVTRPHVDMFKLVHLRGHPSHIGTPILPQPWPPPTWGSWLPAPICGNPQLWSPVDMFKFVYLDLTIQGPPESVEKRVVGFRLKDFLVNDILKIANLLRNCLNLFTIKHCCLPQ